MVGSSHPIKIETYSLDNFKQLVHSGPNAKPEIIDQSIHFVYFEEYFANIKAKTMVIEAEYVDRDFLDDFAGYYVRCLTPYQKNCRRVHFFSIDFSQESFDGLVSGGESPLDTDKLQESYLGFIVLKPLPQTVIGRTCLEPYDSDGRREFPSIRDYEVNLCGLTLKIESLAFQEQDTVTAACATSALWSVFHGTSKLYQHRVPSPVEITKLATKLSPPVSRVLPNTDGLSDWQLAQAIRAVDLEPIAIDARQPLVLKAYCYAYMKSKVPILISVLLNDWSSGKPEAMDHHAVALTGFSIPSTASPVPLPPYGLLLTATRLDKLYAHDDGIGPFARMKFEKDGLSTSWRGKNGKIGSVKAVGKGLLIPVYHKVRIRFAIIFNVVQDFDAFVEECRKHTGCLKGIAAPAPNKPGCSAFIHRMGSGQPNVLDRLEWDIYLTTANEIKKSVRQAHLIVGENCLSILQDHMPRFIWRATAKFEGAPVIDLLFDATDIEQGDFFHRAIEYNKDLAVSLRAYVTHPDLQDWMSIKPVKNIFDWLNKHPNPFIS